MTADREALREKTKEAVKRGMNCWGACAPDGPLRCNCQTAADAAIAVVLEEAAGVAEEMTPRPPQGVPPDWPLPIEIAAAIRALINKEAT